MFYWRLDDEYVVADLTNLRTSYPDDPDLAEVTEMPPGSELTYSIGSEMVCNISLYCNRNSGSDVVDVVEYREGREPGNNTLIFTYTGTGPIRPYQYHVSYARNAQHAINTFYAGVQDLNRILSERYGLRGLSIWLPGEYQDPLSPSGEMREPLREPQVRETKPKVTPDDVVRQVQAILDRKDAEHAEQLRRLQRPNYWLVMWIDGKKVPLATSTSVLDLMSRGGHIMYGLEVAEINRLDVNIEREDDGRSYATYTYGQGWHCYRESD